MKPDIKLAEKMLDVAYEVAYAASSLTNAIEDAEADWKTLEHARIHYQYELPDDALAMMLDDLDYAHRYYTDAVNEITRLDAQIRTLLTLRKEFGEITGFEFTENDS